MTRRSLHVLVAIALVGGLVAGSAVDAGAKRRRAKKAKACARYKPGEQGKGFKTTVVTDRATKKKPIEVGLPIEAGAGTIEPFGGSEVGRISHVFHNVLVDSGSKTKGLWVRLEFAANRDYDLFLNNADGTTVAKAAGFNPHTEGSPLAYNDTSMGGHTEATAEQLDGIKSADCRGYTVDAAAATGPGEILTLKLWLGKANFDPQAKQD
jgi:hypothetical protein